MNHPQPRLATRPSRTARLLLAAIALWALPTGAAAQTTVTNTNDTGAGSLRQALLATPAGGTINFDSGVTGPINLGSQLVVNQGVTLNGPGITLNGQGSSRIFFVDAAGQDVTFNGLTLQDGLGQGGDGGNGTAGAGGGGGGLGAGGAILATSGNLTLIDISLDNNQAQGGTGGNGNTTDTGPSGSGGDSNGASGDAGGGGGGGADDGGGIPGGDGGDGGTLDGASGGGAGAGNGGFGGGGGGGGFGGTTVAGGGGGGGGDDGNGGLGGGGGGDGGFGGGGGGNSSSGVGGGDGGFGGGGGFGGDGGLGGGDGDGFGASGGGAGLGGAVFIAQGVTLTIQNTSTSTNTPGSVTAGGGGGSGLGFGGPGQSAGALLFAQGTNQNLTFSVADGVTQSLDVSGVADETALTGGINTTALTKAGLGTLTLTGVNAFDGALTVNAGRLNVNGLLTNNAAVNAGGTLGGNGTVVNLTNTGGTVAPGNSIDTLNVTGDFSQDASGTLEIEFDGSSIDLLDITGDATLGGTVSFVELATGTPANGPARTFLSAETITGSFATTTTVFASGSTLTGATVSIDDNGNNPATASVVFSDFVAAFEDQALTNTGASAGAALDQLAVSDAAASAPIINALNASANVALALESQGNTAANAAGFQAHRAQQLVADTARGRVWGLSGRTLARQAADRQAAAERAGAQGLFNIADGLETSVEGADTPGFATPVPAQADTDGPSLWAQALGQFSEVNGDGSSLGFDASTYGVSLGAEWADAPRDAVAGLFIGFTETNVEVDGLNDDADIENLQFGLYGAKRLNDRWSLNGSGSISTISFDTSRATASGTADGDFDGLGLYGAIEALYDWDRNEHRVISPFVGIEASFIDRDGYTESGAGALNLTVQDSSDTFLTTILGVQVAADYVLDNGWRLTPAARVGWAFQHLDESATTTSAFAGAAGSTFSTSGPDRSRSSVRLGVSVDLVPDQSANWGLFARYTGDLADGAQEHIVQAGVRFAF